MGGRQFLFFYSFDVGLLPKVRAEGATINDGSILIRSKKELHQAQVLG